MEDSYEDTWENCVNHFVKASTRPKFFIFCILFCFLSDYASAIMHSYGLTTILSTYLCPVLTKPGTCRQN